MQSSLQPLYHSSTFQQDHYIQLQPAGKHKGKIFNSVGTGSPPFQRPSPFQGDRYRCSWVHLAVQPQMLVAIQSQQTYLGHQNPSSEEKCCGCTWQQLRFVDELFPRSSTITHSPQGIKELKYPAEKQKICKLWRIHFPCIWQQATKAENHWLRAVVKREASSNQNTMTSDMHLQ